MKYIGIILNKTDKSDITAKIHSSKDKARDALTDAASDLLDFDKYGEVLDMEDDLEEYGFYSGHRYNYWIVQAED